MGSTAVIYGSTTGNTANAAKQIAAAFGMVPVSIANASPADFNADLVILGSSTWGIGELQDDWQTNFALLEAVDLSGKKVAVFGLGDQNGFGDSFCDAMAMLAEKAVARGATLVGQTSAAGYQHSHSAAERDGMFCGLALDDDSQACLSSGRIGNWVGQLMETV